MESRNGYFKLDMRDAGVFLRVYAPKEGGKPVDIKEVLAYLETKKFNQFDLKEVNRIVNTQKESEETYIGDWNGIHENEMMEVNVSLDKMLAFCRFYAPSNGGKLLTAEDIISDLRLQKIIVGIQTEEINRFLKERSYCTDYILAKGTPPVNGTDAKIEYFFNTNPNLKPKKNEDGTVDYHELNTISRVEAGQLLAKLHQAVKGKPGQDVFGNPIQGRQEKNLKLEFGNNITISEDKTELYSKVTGHASLVNGKVFVSDVYEVPADVDNTTGDINYNGNVSIKGNVKSGFSVKAKGDIVIDGVVEGAFLSAGGQIIVKRGIHGMNKGKVEAKGNIIVKFIENGDVVSGGFIEAGSILHSQVSAATEVRVNGKKGFATGGVIRAGNLVEAQTIGTDMGTITRIEVGVDPEVKERYNFLQKQIVDISKEMEKIKPILVNYSEKVSRQEKISPETVAQVQTIAKKYKEQQEELARLREEFVGIHERIQLQTGARVKVRGSVYQGVTIAISDMVYNVKGTVSHSKFVKEQGEIVTRPL